MKRCVLALSIVLFAGPAARAHFIWIVPDRDGAAAQVIFSDTLKPDDAKLLAKISKTELFARTHDKKPLPLKWTEGKESYRVAPPERKPLTLTAVCTYGVVQRGEGDPFLLNY